MLRFGEFADRAMEQDFRQHMLDAEARGLRRNLLALGLFYLMPMALDFVYFPPDVIFSFLMPLRAGAYVLIIAAMMVPVRTSLVPLRQGLVLALLTYIWGTTSLSALQVVGVQVGLTISFFIMIIVLMNYLFVPTRMVLMLPWGLTASAVYLFLVMPHTDATQSQIQTASVMHVLANVFGAFTAYQLANLRRAEFSRLRQLAAEHARLEDANDELWRREAIIATQRDELARKVRELQDAQSQLVETRDSLTQAEKLASLGGLVAGVAHELNTPIGIALTAITHLEDGVVALDKAVASGKLTRTQLADYQETLRDSARLVHTNVSRATELVQSFKRVAVDQASAERRDFLLGSYIDEVLQSLAPRLRGEPHRIRVDCPSGIHMDSYPGALFQVLTNLVINALIHAFRPGQAGTITIQARELPADQVELRFSDDGRGVGPDHLGRLFEPFFTTNRARGGSGLGLHIVYNLVTQSLRGTITVTSVEGEGTCFTLTLPRHLDREGEEMALERVAG
ncbi:sensor histidine kinase [Niveispirillum sp. KHB5.9]|uniref:sensor histidine kinase n=1 Tax=Niveispirillum sp. KHB5.9 TaxID=3400269 RepID=UPI003A8BD19C